MGRGRKTGGKQREGEAVRGAWYTKGFPPTSNRLNGPWEAVVVLG